MTTMQRLRSVRFVPGDKPRRLAKAQALPADAVILALESPTPPGS
jgi:citrate lyase beta subunit